MSQPTELPSLDQALADLRHTGAWELSLSARDTRRFQRCCGRLDHLAQLPALLMPLWLPYVLLANRLQTRQRPRLALTVDLYAASRNELEKVWGERQPDGGVQICMLLNRQGGGAPHG